MAKTDLNLVVIFDQIMKEQSITVAAERLAMTQPSVSNAVARMRHQWRDPLFVKHGRGVRPTPYALKLWQQVTEPLHNISDAISPDTFDAREATTTFRIALTDGTAAVVMPALRQIIEQEAPNIAIHTVPYKLDGEDLLSNADVDLVFDHYNGETKHIRTKEMFDNHFVCIMNSNHVLASSDLTLNSFLQADHLLVSLSGDATGILDERLAEINKTRRVAMTVNSFAGALNLLHASHLICSMPYSIVAEYHAIDTLAIKPVPIEIPPVKISMAWHCRDDHSPSLRWLRTVIERIVQSKDFLQGAAA
ncbi:LysR family transcriptional regulator [Photobacterium alginatilyticum]|uniref:LysR family transcriptional regulator n=1 Tax=Photobacterium alginatilyticum TaxID=1775171 RepID=A0ABW9YKW0_9GAMM|nr:LysR family transcriptional regulator [Photobacterium alginatilyticum]NBI54182.1 LysR family transcriptional regulator [Photobacterium alginatilyticum]